MQVALDTVRIAPVSFFALFAGSFMSKLDFVLCRVVTWLALAMIAPIATAQAPYPSRPIKLVVPYPPGALTDLLFSWKH